MKEIVKNQFNNHLLVEMDEFFIIIHLLVEMTFVYEFRYVIVPHGLFFLWFLHLRLVLLFLINLIENYKRKYLPLGFCRQTTVCILLVYLVNNIQFRLILYFDLFDLENFRFRSQKLQQTPAYYYYKYVTF